MNKNLTRLSVGVLTLSASGLVAITGYEGFSSDAYIPVKGDKPTIGFGSTQGVKLGDKITVQQGIERLMRDTDKAQSAIRKCVKVPLSQDEYDAYTSFAFNIGAVKFCSSTLVKKLNQGDYDGACKQLKMWIYFHNVPLEGLRIRRNSEFERCVRGH